MLKSIATVIVFSFLYTPNFAASQTTRSLRMNQQQTFANVADGDVFQFLALPKRSYCCSAFPVDGRLSGSSPAIFLSDFQNQSGQPIFDTSSARDRSSVTTGQQKCFMAIGGTSEDGGQIDQNGLLEFSTLIRDGEDSANATLDVVCQETTLYCGYNTNASPFNFLELTNIGDSDREFGDNIAPSRLEAKVFGTSSVTQEDLSFPDQLLRTGLRRVDLDLHSTVGENTFGILHVSHNGGPGSVQAQIGRYKRDAGGELSPVDRITCSTRKFLPN